MRLSTESLARASSRRPWLVVCVWLVALVLGVVCTVLLLGDALSNQRVLGGTDFARGEKLLEERLPDPESPDEFIIVRSTTATVEDAAFRQRVEELTREVEETGIATATNYYDDPERSLVSDDKDATAISLAMTSSDETVNEEKVGELVDLVERTSGQGGFEVYITGHFTSERDLSVLSEEDLQKGEMFFGAPAALLILLLVFGTVVAALLPLALSVVSILIGLGLVGLMGTVWEPNLFIVNMLSGMGLALGIDYTLFVLARFREERARGLDKYEAIAAAGATSSRAVFFSGIVFVLALTGMLMVPDSVLRSLAAGAIIVGIVSVLAALTFLPALMALLGDRINALRVPIVGRNVERAGSGEGRFWGAVAHRVMRRPVVSLVLASALLLAPAIAVLDLEIGDNGISLFPDRLPSKAGFLVLNEEFPGATAEPAQVVINGDVRSEPVRAAIERLEQGLRADDVYGPPQVDTNEAGDLAVVSVPLAGDSTGGRAKDAVKDLRSDYIPAAFADVDAEVVVTGTTAETVDASDTGTTWLPIVFAFVLVLSFVMLMIAFHSIVVPLKAILLNLLSVGAAYGLVVLVFQKGYLTDFLGFRQVDTIDSWVPLFLFSVLFALSMDYHVFLISRIRERFLQTRNNTEAVAWGVSSSARLITGAALIMVAVFTGFALGDLVMFQEMGFGLAVALIVDATIVRSVLVPASMRLLGERNWYLPGWLQWLPTVDVEGQREPPPSSPAERAA
jgi:RND superfamily putative drug exporter